MDPGHHTAYLLAILICILLLLLAASALLMCYLRRNGFNISNRKSSMRLGAAMRNQSTSMSSFAWNFLDSKPPVYGDHNDTQAMVLPTTVDRSKQPPSPLSPGSHMLCISDDEDGTPTSGLDSKSVKKKRDPSGQYSALKYMLSSGASLLGSVLEKSTMFSLKAKRRSSSLKSGVNMDILMVPLESPVRVSTLDERTSQEASLPENLSRNSTLLCENSCDQQFTWDTVGLSIQSDHITQKETGFVSSALKGKPYYPEERSTVKDEVLFRNPDYLQPKAWFISIGDRPVSDGVQLEKKGLNNVASLDSGVDTAEMLSRPGSGGFNPIPKEYPGPCVNNVLPSSFKEHSRASNSQEEMQEVEEAKEECHNLYITHQEAARTLNPGYSGRSLWEKREERPLIGVN